MQVVRQHVHGTVLGQNGRFGLLLKDASPAAETADSLYLSFAFLTQGKEEHILPAFVLDDWGAEIRSLRLYQWVHDFGDQFPRAEIFGFSKDGQKTQRFLREIELHARLPCYVYGAKEMLLAEGRLIEAVLLPDASVSTTVQIKRPSHLERPLRSAQVSWWLVDPATKAFNFETGD